MKNFIIILLLLFTSTTLSAQKEELVKIMAKETCDCIVEKNIDLQSSSDDELTLKLGVCIMQSYALHKDEYEKVTGKELNYEDDTFGELGEEIGMAMMVSCPEVLLQIGLNENIVDDQEYDSEEITGTITKIEKNQFYTIYLKTENNNTMKLLFLHEINNSNLLLDETKWKNKKVTLEYSILELFDPRIDEFSNFNVIDSIEVE